MYIGENLKTDPGVKAYKDSDWALKTNGRDDAQKKPLLRGFANYGDRETDAKRWVGMLYNHRVSLGIGYFANNPKYREASKIDVVEGGFLKRMAKSEIGENEKAILKAHRTTRSVMNGRSTF